MPNVYSRHSNLFKPERVAEILQQIKIEEDLSSGQQHKVFPVDFKTFKYTFLEGTKFNTKCAFLYEWLNELKKASIICRISPKEVKAASPTVLAQKAHGSGSLPLYELLHCVNDQCATHGLPTRDDLPQRPTIRNTGTNKNEAELCRDQSR
ncbi:uncharacterized protein F5147DRAFT_768755 [Suillus discolor]|uniref:Uncharacterized protein n=1 Tax=Suillus discolor TaxID=1912936 RepID=A0A9P7JZR2_9AGAM|nr:uncharacterized protein F5147DRAFT_768755 [Suillus discolor]KAG2117384.1 hypothetical protein F5147DRAFT_768755 [Suillus discolor]